jgi:hypothetical protein
MSTATVARAESTLTDKQQARLAFRVALFKRRGWDERKALDYADRLVERDAELDPRRLCQECAHLQTGSTCFSLRQEHKRLTSIADKDERIRASRASVFGAAHPQSECITDILIRCPNFEFVKPA